MMASLLAKGNGQLITQLVSQKLLTLLLCSTKQVPTFRVPTLLVIGDHGVTELHPVEHEVDGDRIEAGTFLARLLVSLITVHGLSQITLGLVLTVCEQMGITIETGDSGARASRQQDLKSIGYPDAAFILGFSTDTAGTDHDAACSGRQRVPHHYRNRLFENRFYVGV